MEIRDHVVLQMTVKFLQAVNYKYNDQRKGICR